MESVDIKDISGNLLLTTIINEGCKRKFTLQKEDYILLKFSLESPVFKLGSYVECDFGRFEVCDLQKPTFNTNTAGYDYKLQLDAYYWKWKNKIFKYTPEAAGQEASWNLTASLDVQAGIVLRNLKALGYTYKGQDFDFSIDSTVENKSQLMSYDNINILDACFEMAKKWDCECWVTENIIHFGRCEFGDPVDFEIGVNVGEMTRSDSQSTYATRIYAFGSTRNIPANYRPVDGSMAVNGVVQRRLMLPVGTPYIDAYPNMSPEEAVEQVVIFDDIYPRRIGTITAVSAYEDTVDNEDGTQTTETFYRFTDTGINFSEDYVLEEEELHIIFQSGNMNGMDFAVKFNPLGKPEKKEDGSWNVDAQIWEIVANEDYGRKLPDSILKPEAGNTYVLYGWNSTKIAELGLVASAEQELKTETEKYASKSKIDPNTYDCTMRSNHVYDETGLHNLYELGQKVNLLNKAYFENGRQSRIIGFEYNLDYPFDSPVYTVGETAAYSRIGEIEEKIESITLAGQTYTGGGGSGVYLIRRNDSTPATDSNVFSALRSLAEFINKKKDDTAKGLITFLKGILIGNKGHGISVSDSNVVTAILDELKNISGIVSPDFVSGDLGTGFVLKYDKERGRSYLEVDELLVRKLAYFVELVIKRLSYVGGEIILTPASMKCSKVETYDTYYRCYFEQDDGDRSIVQEFRAGDQARCQTFNVQEGTSHNVSNTYYWRLVTAVGKDYIDLSVGDCDAGSMAPAAGDHIVQLGNRDDDTRQNAIILSTVGDDAPSFKQYKGIDSYSMSGKEVTIISPSLNKFMGEFISAATGKEYDEIFSNLQNDMDLVREQADREYTIWFFDYVPTLNNIPASEWTTPELIKLHDQDLFYNRTSGLAYRFENGAWVEVTDQFTIKAMENAAKAQDTADGKRRVLVSQPTADSVYDVGDLWVNATYGSYKNDSLVCITAKKKGMSFSISHWQPSSTATTAYLENLGDQILQVAGDIQDHDTSIAAAQALANQGVNDAYDAYRKALEALGVAEDAGDAASSNYTVIQQTKNSIAALANKISFDGSGNVSNISTSGLVTTSDFNTLLSKKVSFDGSGNVSNISTSGLVTTSGFAQLFSERVTADGLVKRAEISTFITEDDAGRLISNATIQADKINFLGKTTINGNFIVDNNGNVTMNNATVSGVINATKGVLGSMEISHGGDGTVSGLYYSYDNTELRMQPRWTSVMNYNVFAPPTEMNVEFYMKRARGNARDRVLYLEGVAEVYGRLGIGKNPAANGFVSGFPALVTEGLSNYGQTLLSPVVITSSTTLTDKYTIVLVRSTSSSTITLTLPEANWVKAGTMYVIRKIGSGNAKVYGKIMTSDAWNESDVKYNSQPDIKNGRMSIFIYTGSYWTENLMN